MTITPRHDKPLRPRDKPDPMNHMERPAMPLNPADDTGIRLRVTALQMAHNAADSPDTVVQRAQSYHVFMLGVYDVPDAEE